LGGIAQTPFLWGTNTAFVPGFAIPLVWLAQLRAGQYAGRPLSAEAPVPNGPAGAVYQVFEHGLATFVPGQAATFTGTGLSDAQLAGILPSPHLWGSTIPFNATFAIPQAWLAQLRAGSYRGRPLSPEVSLPGAAAGAVLQVFEYGLALYRPGQGVSWTG